MGGSFAICCRKKKAYVFMLRHFLRDPCLALFDSVVSETLSTQVKNQFSTSLLMHLSEVNDNKHKVGAQMWMDVLMIPNVANPIWNTS